ncbi:hypothetical protein ACQKDY_09865 [Alteromonas macleodii]|uniref:hypothetical protein n=1 Tax=Alteromonas macleodii TaxID=28108 RepID=UPI003CFC33CE
MSTNFDVTEYLRMEIEAAVKDTIYNDMLDEFLKEAEEKFAEVMRPKLALITFDRIERVRDLAKMRDEIRVSINGVEESGVKADE